jgi:hypothetical protein
MRERDTEIATTEANECLADPNPKVPSLCARRKKERRRGEKQQHQQQENSETLKCRTLRVRGSKPKLSAQPVPPPPPRFPSRRCKCLACDVSA